jgi:UDP-N-acetylmuramoyl-tripeptide--D-alanyl-D-alanine ligase
MKAALSALASIGSERRRIAVLGDMLELGDMSEALHRSVGSEAANSGVDILVTVGHHSRYIAAAYSRPDSSVRSFSFDTCTEALEFLKPLLIDGDVVLVKGSRGMKMEEIAGPLMEGK